MFELSNTATEASLGSPSRDKNPDLHSSLRDWLLQLLEALLHGRSIQRQILPVLLQQFLSLFTQHETDELADLRVDRFAWHDVDPERLAAPKRIAVVLQGFHRVMDERARVRRSKIEDLYIAWEVGVVANVSDPVWIVANVIDYLVRFQVSLAVRLGVVGEAL